MIFHKYEFLLGARNVLYAVALYLLLMFVTSAISANKTADIVQKSIGSRNGVFYENLLQQNVELPNRQLVQYIPTSVGNKLKFKCSFCSMTFSRLGDQKNHARTVHKILSDERPYQCSACDQTFVVSNKLQQHTQSHHAALELSNYIQQQKSSIKPKFGVEKSRQPEILQDDQQLNGN